MVSLNILVLVKISHVKEKRYIFCCLSISTYLGSEVTESEPIAKESVARRALSPGPPVVPRLQPYLLLPTEVNQSEPAAEANPVGPSNSNGNLVKLININIINKPV